MNQPEEIRQKYLSKIRPVYGEEGCNFFDAVMSMSLAMVLIATEVKSDGTRRVLEATINQGIGLAADNAHMIDDDLDAIMEEAREALEEIRKAAHACRHH